MKPKIAVIGLKGLPAFGGAATVGENIIENLKDCFEFTVYSTASHTNLKTGNINGYRQIVVRKLRFKKLNSLYYYIISAFHAVIKGNFHLIHLHHRDASFIIPILRIRYKVILTTHGMVLTKKWEKFAWFFKIQDRIFLRMANIITCVSKKDQNIVKRLLGKKNVIHIPNGVNIHNEFPSITKKTKLCFAAGRIVPDKGLHILLEALINIEFKESILIIGDVDQMPSYKEKVIKLASSLPNVKFLDLIKERDALYKYIASSELFVYPSLIESMSMMLLEVASLKIPILCSNIIENRDVFNNSEVLFFEPNNIKNIGEKILWAMDNNNKMLTLSVNAFNKVLQHHNWENISKKYKNQYVKLLYKK